MNVEAFFQSLLQALGWALLQFLWQGTLVAIGTAAALTLLRKRAAATRYLVTCIALALMLILPAATLLRGIGDTGGGTGDHSASAWRTTSAAAERGTPGAAAEKASPANFVDASLAMVRSSLLRLQAAARPLLPHVAMAWFFGVLFLSFRLLRSWHHLQYIMHEGTEPAPERWQIVVSDLMERMGIRRSVRLLSSKLTEVPAAFGWLRPVILIPVSALCNLSVEQMETILAHELAHIRRHDYAVNLLQSAIEILLFYHPAVWWVSGKMRIERENCCDDVAVEVCDDVKTYARALVALEELRRAPVLAVAANGGALLPRIRRLLQGGETDGRSPAGALLGVLGVLFMSFIVLAAGAQKSAMAAMPPVEKLNAAVSTATAAGGVSEEEVRRITAEALRVVATCADRETLRRCADYQAQEVKLECWPSNGDFRSGMDLLGEDGRRQDETDPTRILQTQITELLRQKLGGAALRLSDFPECRDSR